MLLSLLRVPSTGDWFQQGFENQRSKMLPMISITMLWCCDVVMLWCHLFKCWWSCTSQPCSESQERAFSGGPLSSSSFARFFNALGMASFPEAFIYAGYSSRERKHSLVQGDPTQVDLMNQVCSLKGFQLTKWKAPRGSAAITLTTMTSQHDTVYLPTVTVCSTVDHAPVSNYRTDDPVSSDILFGGRDGIRHDTTRSSSYTCFINIFTLEREFVQRDETVEMGQFIRPKCIGPFFVSKLLLYCLRSSISTPWHHNKRTFQMSTSACMTLVSLGKKADNL